MRIIQIQDYKTPHKLKSLIIKHLGDNSTPIGKRHGYVLTEKDKILGYALYDNRNSNIFLDWIWTKPGYGTPFLKKLENKWKKNKKVKVILKMSIDPTEKKEKVLRRINYYIKNKYRAKDIKFRSKYGPILTMEKKL